MSSRHAMAIDLGPRRLRALLATQSRGRRTLKVIRTLVETAPADLNIEDAHELGRWAGDRLRAAGFPRGKATFVIGRELVGLKRLTLPTIESSELPEMTRLAMQRELPFDAETAVIDFVPVDRNEISTTVLAIAVPHRVVEFIQAAAKAAHLGVERITLRSMGAAAVAGSRAAASARSLLVDVLGESVEFCLIEDGEIRTSRAAEVPAPQDRLAIAETVITESRRTWMSYHSSGAAGINKVDDVIMMGDRRVSDYAADPVSQVLSVEVCVLQNHPLIECSSGGEAQNAPIDGLWSLAGVLLEPLLGRETIDFANPRHAPDLAGQTRKRRLMAAGIAIIALAGAWTAARQNLASLDRDATALLQSQRDQTKFVGRYWRDFYKLEHLKHWEEAKVDWLEHATYLTSIAPTRDRLVLDSWIGVLDFKGVKYDKTTGKWSVDQQLIIDVEGEARDRETADSFRAALVQSKVYGTGTPGADTRAGKRMPFGFTYRLRAKNGVLPNAVEVKAANPDPKAPAEQSS